MGDHPWVGGWPSLGWWVTILRMIVFFYSLIRPTLLFIASKSVQWFPWSIGCVLYYSIALGPNAGFWLVERKRMVPDSCRHVPRCTCCEQDVPLYKEPRSITYLIRKGCFKKNFWPPPLCNVVCAKASMIDGNENFSWLRVGEENIVGNLQVFWRCGIEALLGSMEILCIDTVIAVAHRIKISFVIETIFMFELL